MINTEITPTMRNHARGIVGSVALSCKVHPNFLIAHHSQRSPEQAQKDWLIHELNLHYSFGIVATMLEISKGAVWNAVLRHKKRKGYS